MVCVTLCAFFPCLTVFVGLAYVLDFEILLPLPILDLLASVGLFLVLTLAVYLSCNKTLR